VTLEDATSEAVDEVLSARAPDEVDGASTMVDVASWSSAALVAATDVRVPALFPGLPMTSIEEVGSTFVLGPAEITGVEPGLVTGGTIGVVAGPSPLPPGVVTGGMTGLVTGPSPLPPGRVTGGMTGVVAGASPLPPGLVTGGITGVVAGASPLPPGLVIGGKIVVGTPPGPVVSICVTGPDGPGTITVITLESGAPVGRPGVALFCSDVITWDAGWMMVVVTPSGPAVMVVSGCDPSVTGTLLIMVEKYVRVTAEADVIGAVVPVKVEPPTTTVALGDATAEVE